jgi:hypothetical protein
MNNDYKRVFLNWSVMTNLIDAKLKLKPDLIFNSLSSPFRDIYCQDLKQKEKEFFNIRFLD